MLKHRVDVEVYAVCLGLEHFRTCMSLGFNMIPTRHSGSLLAQPNTGPPNASHDRTTESKTEAWLSVLLPGDPTPDLACLKKGAG